MSQPVGPIPVDPLQFDILDTSLLDVPRPRVRRTRGLDLNSWHFVSFAGVPWFPRDNLVFIADVLEEVSGQSPQFYCRDTDGVQMLLKFHLKLETNDRFVQDEVLVGGPGMVCIRAPRMHRFLDGQIGLRVEDEDMASNFKYFPGCSVASFKKLNERLAQSLTEPKCEKCANVDARNLCSKCRCARYCSRECQQQHWRVHKFICNIVKTLREYEEVFGSHGPQ